MATFVYSWKNNSIYDPTIGRNTNYTELSKLKTSWTVRDNTGKDVTDFVRQRLAVWKARKNKKLKKQQALNKKIDNEKGYYCDCKMSKKYTKPSQIPAIIEKKEEEASVKFTKVEVDKNKACIFCGYTAVWYNTTPEQGRSKRKMVDLRVEIR